MVLLLRFLSASMLTLGLALGLMLVSSPAQAADSTKHAERSKPAVHLKRVAHRSLISGHGRGGITPPKSVHGRCFTNTNRVMFKRVAAQPRRGCSFGGANIVFPVLPEPFTAQPVVVTAEFPVVVEPVVVEPVVAEPVTAGDPPPPGEEPAEWGPGSADWDLRVTVP